MKGLLYSFLLQFLVSFVWFQFSIASFNSCSFLMKLVLLSDLISSGRPLRLSKCPKAIMKSSVSNVGISSRETVRVVKQVKRHPRLSAELRPHLSINGLKKSTPENVKGGCIPSFGRGDTTDFICPFRIGDTANNS